MIITYGEKLPILDTMELIDIFKKVLLIVTENSSMQFNNNHIQNIISSFEIAIRNVLSFFLQSLKNILFDDETKLIEAKQSLNRLRKGDLFELSKYLFNLPLLPIPFTTQFIGFIMKVSPKMVLELIASIDEFNRSCNKMMINFLTRSLICFSDLLMRIKCKRQ